MKNYDYWTETLFSLLRFMFFRPTQKLSIYLYNAYIKVTHWLTDWLTYLPIYDTYQPLLERKLLIADFQNIFILETVLIPIVLKMVENFSRVCCLCILGSSRCILVLMTQSELIRRSGERGRTPRRGLTPFSLEEKYHLLIRVRRAKTVDSLRKFVLWKVGGEWECRSMWGWHA